MRTPVVLIAVVFSLSSFTRSIARAEDAAHSSDVSKAESLAAAAFDAYSHKDYEGAVAVYLKALDAVPSADILYNLARIYDSKLKKRARAIEFYQRYADDTGADPERLRTARARMVELRELESASNEAPPPPLRSQTSTAAPSLPPPSAAGRESGLNALQFTGIVGTVIGLSGLGVGTGFGIAAKSKADVAQNYCHGNACTAQRGVDASRDAARLATVSTIGFIAGGALTALGITLLLVGGRAESDRAPRAELTPYLRREGAGASLIGRW
ncbi:MAG TPA: hypothetical protein VHZ95_17410 [Polyangiales bacterium]|nr:hypothetical protein [Polyangiales bacterium]